MESRHRKKPGSRLQPFRLCFLHASHYNGASFLHTLRQRAMHKGRSIRGGCLNDGNSAILFSPDTCLVGSAKRQVRTSWWLHEYRKLCNSILSRCLPGRMCWLCLSRWRHGSMLIFFVLEFSFVWFDYSMDRSWFFLYSVEWIEADLVFGDFDYV